MRLFGIDFNFFRPEDFIRAMPIFASMLTASDQFRRWIVGGTEAKTDASTVWLPGIKIKSPREAYAFLGYAIHELGHRWTDMGVLAHVHSAFQKHLWNSLEDCARDTQQHRLHPGSKEVLDSLSQYLIEEGNEPMPTRNMHPVQLMQLYIQYRLRSSMVGEAAYDEYADLVEQYVADVLPAPILTKLRALMFEVKPSSDSWEVLDITNRIIDMLRHENEKWKNEQAQASAQGGGSQGSSQPGAAPEDGNASGEDCDNDSQGSMSCPDDSSAEDAEDGEGGMPHDGSSAPDADDDNGDSEQGVQDSNDNGEGAGNDASEQEGDSGNSAGSIRTVIDDLLGMTDEDMIKDIGEKIRDMVNDMAEEQLASGEFNPDLWYTPDEHLMAVTQGSLGEEMDRVYGSVNALRHRLMRLVQAKTRSRMVEARSGKKLTGRKLYRLSIGNTAVFERRIDGMSIDTAVILLMDVSSSMGWDEEPIHGAKDATLALSLALDSIPGVKHVAAVFPGPSSYVNGQTLEGIGVLKRFGESAKTSVLRYAGVSPTGGTPLHIALVWSAKELATVKAARKIVFVITDGKPNEEDAAKDAMYDLARFGVQTIGVGIKVDVGHLFDKFVRINHVDELSDQLFGYLRTELLAA